MIELTQADGFQITGRGPVVICHESYYDFDPRPKTGDRVRIDGKLAIIKGIEAFLTNPPNYGEHLSILVAWEDDEEYAWTWRNLCPYVGYHVRLSGSVPKQYQERKLKLAKNKLERVVKEFDADARVVMQESVDFVGFPVWWARVWIHPGVEDFRDVWGMREHLEESGHHVSSIDISYEPPMA